MSFHEPGALSRRAREKTCARAAEQHRNTRHHQRNSPVATHVENPVYLQRTTQSGKPPNTLLRKDRPNMEIAKAFSFRQMPPGRHAFALSQVATLARAANLPQTAARAIRAAAQAHVTLELKQRWLATRDTHELARLLDVQIGVLQQKLHAATQGNTKDPHVGMANELLEKLFPQSIHKGRNLTTHQVVELEQGEVYVILKRLDTEFSHLVEMLSIDRQIERIRAANNELCACRINREDVRSAEKRLHAETCKTIATLFLELDGDDPKTIAEHKRILIPFTAQQRHVYLARSHSHTITDIHPNTGEELPLS